MCDQGAVCALFVLWRLTMKISQYFFNVAVGIDQLGNTIIGGAPDETISSRCYRHSDDNRFAAVARKVIDFIFSIWEENHCYEAFKSEQERNHFPPELHSSDLDDK